MPVIAGWLTGEQVSDEIIQQTLLAMGEVLGQHGGQPAWTVQPGAGLLTHFDPDQAVQQNDEPPVLDWVPERRTLVYRRPLSGAHVLYYIEDWPAKGNLVFASEIKALLAIGAPRRLHLEALDALWRYGFIPAPWTAFKDIRVVPAGAILRWQQAKTVVNTSTDYRFEDSLPLSTAQEQLSALLKTSITHLLPPDENQSPLVTLTGGGPGSALISTLAAQQTQKELLFASLGYMKTINAKAWSGVKGLAEYNQRPFLGITAVDQPEFWTATIAGLESPAVDTRPLALHQLLHTIVEQTEARSAFTGLGTKVLFAQEQKPPEEKNQETSLDRYIHNIRGYTKTFPFWSHDRAQALQVGELWEETLHARKLARRATQFTQQAQQNYYLDLHLRLPDLLVGPTQQLAIQEKLALRSPFLHADVIDLVTRLESSSNKTQLLTDLIGSSLGTGLPFSIISTSLVKETENELWQQTLTRVALEETGLFQPESIAYLLKEKLNVATIRSLLFIFTTQLFYKMFELEQ